MINQGNFNPELQGELRPDLFNRPNEQPLVDLNETGQRYNDMVHQAFGVQEQEEAKHIADNDLELQTGTNNQLLDSEGRRVNKNDSHRDELADNVVSLERSQGDKLRIRLIARKMHVVTKRVLKDQGIEPLTNVGQGGETAEMTLIGDNVVHMQNSGGAKELDPTATRQVERITDQDIGLETIRAIDRDPSKITKLYEDDKAKAEVAARAVSVLRQRGSVNHRMSEDLGKRMRAA